MWRVIGQYIEPPLDQRGLRITNWLRGDAFKGGSDATPFDGLPIGDVLEWVEADIAKRAPLVAYFAPTRFDDIKQEDSFIRQLLIRYGDRENVGGSLESNFSTGGWMGPASAHYAGQKRQVEELLEQEQNLRVREWLATYASHLTEQIERERVREEREF